MVAQLVRALACHARGRGFEPHPSRHSYASVAQLVEQRTENPRVVGSIPTEGTNFAGLAHLVERHLAKVEVASSSLVIRSNPHKGVGFIFVCRGSNKFEDYREKQESSMCSLYSLYDNSKLKIL